MMETTSPADPYHLAFGSWHPQLSWASTRASAMLWVLFATTNLQWSCLKGPKTESVIFRETKRRIWCLVAAEHLEQTALDRTYGLPFGGNITRNFIDGSLAWNIHSISKEKTTGSHSPDANTENPPKLYHRLRCWTPETCCHHLKQTLSGSPEKHHVVYQSSARN
jgi:hypothetical protein